MKIKKFVTENITKIAAVLAALLVLLLAVIGIIEIPRAMSNDTQEIVQFEEIDTFTIAKMEMTTHSDAYKEVNNYYVTLKNDHVIFMAEVNLEQYIYYNIGDTIPGTLIVENENENMYFELDEFGKSFDVLGYIGLTN